MKTDWKRENHVTSNDYLCLICLYGHEYKLEKQFKRGKNYSILYSLIFSIICVYLPWFSMLTPVSCCPRLPCPPPRVATKIRSSPSCVSPAAPHVLWFDVTLFRARLLALTSTGRLRIMLFVSLLVLDLVSLRSNVPEPLCALHVCFWFVDFPFDPGFWVLFGTFDVSLISVFITAHF